MSVLSNYPTLASRRWGTGHAQFEYPTLVRMHSSAAGRRWRGDVDSSTSTAGRRVGAACGAARTRSGAIRVAGGWRVTIGTAAAWLIEIATGCDADRAAVEDLGICARRSGRKSFADRPTRAYVNCRFNGGDTSAFIVKRAWRRLSASDGPKLLGELRPAVDGDEWLRVRHRAVGTTHGKLRPDRRPVVGREMPHGGIGIPAYADSSETAVAREPHPAVAVEPVPRAAVIGPPTPGISGNPGVSNGWIVTPGADAEGVPVGAHAGRRPGLAVVGDVVPVAVIVEVVPGRIVGIAGAGAGSCCALFQGRQGLIAVRIPLVPGIGCNALDQVVLAGVLGVEVDGMVGA